MILYNENNSGTKGISDMIMYSYPLRKIIKTCIWFLGFLILASACKKETYKNPPNLQLLTGNEYITDSSVVAIGFPYTIGINAIKGDAAITNLVVTLTTENGMETALDSGMYSGNFTYLRHINYGATRFEKWSFMVRDKNGKSSSIAITIMKDTASAFGPIKFHSSLKLTAQNNPVSSSFYSIENGITYTLQEAETNQSNINIITYFGDKLVPSTDFTLSSPGESDVSLFYPMIVNWSSPLNETRYKPDSLSISQSAFDAAYNDSLIITNYTSATIGKRKFKNVHAGYVIPFQVTAGALNGKRGLLRVKSMQNGPGGFIIADIKVQK